VTRGTDDPVFQPTDVPTSKGFLYADWRPVSKLHVLPNVDLASDRWTVNSAGTRSTTRPVVMCGQPAGRLRAHRPHLFDTSYQLVDGFPEAGRGFFVSARARY
jgi:iron complex outermembrane receptor protein